MINQARDLHEVNQAVHIIIIIVIIVITYHYLLVITKSTTFFVRFIFNIVNELYVEEFLRLNFK